LAKEHKHHTGKIKSSERRLAPLASISDRHVHRVLVALEGRNLITRKTKEKSAYCLTEFTLVDFNFVPRSQQETLFALRNPGASADTGRRRSADMVSAHSADMVSAAYKEERKIKEKPIPPTPLLQRGDAPTVVTRRRLTARDLRELVKAVDVAYAEGVVEFQEAFEIACQRRLIHPSDAKRSIGLKAEEVGWEDRRRPPEREQVG
jgi:hypothetical protein